MNNLLFPRNFYTFKTRLYSILVLGLICDLSFRFNFHIDWIYKKLNISLVLPSCEIQVVLIASLILIFLVVINFIHNKRRQRF